MIITLPSNGLFGLHQTVLNTPKLGHIRSINSASYTDEQLKTEFVRMLLEHPEDLSKMTLCDRDFLFDVAASGVCLNQISTDFVCPLCKDDNGNPVTNSVVYDITQQELIALDEDTPVEVKKRWDGIDMDVTYRFLSVPDEEKIINYALADYENYTLRYEQAFIAATLGQPIVSVSEIEASIKRVDEYPMYVYFSALLFSQMTFHGVPQYAIGKCSHCGGDIKVIIPFTAAVTTMDSAKIVNRFMSLSGMVTFKDFLDLSMPELSQMELNLRNSGE